MEVQTPSNRHSKITIVIHGKKKCGVRKHLFCIGTRDGNIKPQFISNRCSSSSHWHLSLFLSSAHIFLQPRINLHWWHVYSVGYGHNTWAQSCKKKTCKHSTRSMQTNQMTAFFLSNKIESNFAIWFKRHFRLLTICNWFFDFPPHFHYVHLFRECEYIACSPYLNHFTQFHTHFDGISAILSWAPAFHWISLKLLDFVHMIDIRRI